jgi:excisionase family DNA binding protein
LFDEREWSTEMQSTNEAPAKLLYTVEEAGRLLGIKRTTMYELIRTGTLTSVRVGRLRRLRYGDLVTYAGSLASERGSAADVSAA